MKTYTDLEQSKKLAEILPLESADMHYLTYSMYEEYCDEIVYTINLGKPGRYDKCCIPCWSLSALLDILPKTLEDGFYDEYELNINMIDKKPEYIGLDNQVHSDFPYNFNNKELLDNIVESIMWLHKQNLL